LAAQLRRDQGCDALDLARVVHQVMYPDQVLDATGGLQGIECALSPAGGKIGFDRIGGYVDRVHRLTLGGITRVAPAALGVGFVQEGLDPVPHTVENPHHSSPAPSGMAPVKGAGSPVARRSSRMVSTTAAATDLATSVSNTLGMMKEALRSESLTVPAIATAVARSTSSLMDRARASSRPRNRPGKASTLVLWFGESLRPVATTAACSAASIGSASGFGLARAKTMAPSAMVAISAPLRIPPAETPMKTSAPASPSFSEPVKASSLVLSAIHCR